MKNIKVLYIAGTSRCGSTILSNILGQINGFFSVGELRYIWRRGLIENWLCGCGKSFKKCLFWNQILSNAFSKEEKIDVINLNRQDQLLTYNFSKKLFQKKPCIKDLSGKLQKIYLAINEVTNEEVIVDSSKDPGYALLLSNMTNIELFILHLVRDSRAVAFSRLKRKKKILGANGNVKYMGKGLNPLKVSTNWNRINTTIENKFNNRNIKYLLLRYEDFTNEPQISIKKVLRFIDKNNNNTLYFENNNEVALGGNHVFSGNPIRFQSGKVKIIPDDKWEHELDVITKKFVTVMTIKGLKKYNYII